MLTLGPRLIAPFSVTKRVDEVTDHVPTDNSVGIIGMDVFRNLGRARVIVQWVGHLPYMQLTRVQSPASHMSPEHCQKVKIIIKNFLLTILGQLYILLTFGTSNLLICISAIKHNQLCCFYSKLAFFGRMRYWCRNVSTILFEGQFCFLRFKVHFGWLR